MTDDLIRAAAVCVRVFDDRMQLLVVGTKEPQTLQRWTFPKGHIESGESLPAAALREASEEAGVKGTADTRSLPHIFSPVPDRPRWW